MLFWTAGSVNRSATPVRLALYAIFFPISGRVVLAVRLLDMRQQLCPFTHEMHPAPEEVSCGAHLGGIDIGLGKHSAAQQHRNLMGIDFVVFGFSHRGWLSCRARAQGQKAVPREHTGQPASTT